MPLLARRRLNLLAAPGLDLVLHPGSLDSCRIRSSVPRNPADAGRDLGYPYPVNN